MRLFIAIKFNNTVNSALLSVQDQMKRENIHGKYSKPENLHLTLAFIGEYSDPDHVLEVLEQVRFRPFEIKLDGVGSFGMRSWWAGISAPDELKNTAAQIRHYLAEAGIPFDKKKFSPHITLIREPDKAALSSHYIPDAHMTVEEITLFRSDRGRVGMNYTELGTIQHI